MIKVLGAETPAFQTAPAPWTVKANGADFSTLDIVKVILAERGGFEPPVQVLARTTV